MMTLLALLVAGCNATANETAPAESPTTAPVAAAEQPTSAPSEPLTGPVATTTSPAYAETEDTRLEIKLPKPENRLDDGVYSWNQLLTRDAIRPIYEPKFTDAGSAPYAGDELVIGVAISGEAKAYAIGPLNSREMVNDTVGGTPVLVTW